jgi:hypothetical protein
MPTLQRRSMTATQTNVRSFRRARDATGMFSFVLILFILTTFNFYHHETLLLPNQTPKVKEG